MTEQEVQAAERWKANKHDWVSVIDAVLLANSHPLVSPPPTLEAADSTGPWWIKSKEGEPWIVSVERDESGFFHEINGYRFPAEGGLWQRVVGPFGMEGKA